MIYNSFVINEFKNQVSDDCSFYKVGNGGSCGMENKQVTTYEKQMRETDERNKQCVTL